MPLPIRFFHLFENTRNFQQLFIHLPRNFVILIDLFTNTAAILDSIVSDIYYGMLRGQIYANIPSEHPIITI